MDSYIERHFDYVLGPNQDGQLSSVAAGKSLTCVLKLDSDAPFILRSRALRSKYTTDGNDQTGLNHILARWYGPNRMYTSTNLVRQSLLGPYFGQIGMPIPIQKELFYPPMSEIRVDIKNDGASALTNLLFLFRGVKLYRPGAVKSYGYPDRFGIFPFTYPITVTALPVTTATSGIRQVFTVKPDADFVMQGLQAGFNSHADPSGNSCFEVFIKLKDEDEKPYSNDLVPIDLMAGNSGFGAVYPAGTNNHIPAVAGGPNMPGLVYPEIYLPKNHLFYFDISRNDGAYGTAAVDYPLALIGQKVFAK